MNEAESKPTQPTSDRGQGPMDTESSSILPVDSRIKTFQSFLQRAGRRAERTASVYGSLLHHFAAFLQKPTLDDTVQVITKLDPYDLLDAYVGWLLDQGYSAKTVLSAITAAKKWLRYQGVKVYDEELKDRVELPRPREPLDEAPTREQIKRIISRMTYTTQNKMLLLSCSGIRPVDIQFLKPTDFKWDENPVRLVVPPYGKTGRGWETFITDELAERLRDDREFYHHKGKHIVSVLSKTFRREVDRALNVESIETGRGAKRRKLHLYSLKKFFFSQATAEVGDAVAHAWCGRKSYLSTYLRLPLEEKGKLYFKVMPRLTIFSIQQPKTEDRLRSRLKQHGLTDEIVDRVLEGLILA